jgi:prepilin-type N-terminal cleavage/methylation domain-containing protein
MMHAANNKTSMVAGRGGRTGFTLIEVALAVLVVGVGLLAVFSLFPSGLRSAEEGAADTKCGLFADTILNGMQGNAATITNWNDWCNGATFRGDVLAGLLVTTSSVAKVIAFPDGGTGKNRYTLTIDTSNSNRYSATLQVWDGEYGALTYPSVFYTEFVFSRF